MRRFVAWSTGFIACVVVGVALVPHAAHAAKPDRASSLVELGRRLFMDPTVSASGRFSCASCHDPEAGFSDPRPRSEDENGATNRHSQTLIDLRDGHGIHWDGEFDTVRELLVARLAPPADALALSRTMRTRAFERSRSRGDRPDTKEFRRRLQSLTPPYYGPSRTPGGRQRPTRTPAAVRLQQDDFYGAGFQRAFGSGTVTTERIIDALEAYTLSIRSGESPYDRYLAGDPGALSLGARRGYGLFTGKANCVACHTDANEKGPDFTDLAFHNTGVAFKNVVIDFEKGFTADGGLGGMNFVAKDLGKFKTPTLRDVARTAPYMHDGSLATLTDVVGYYNKGGTRNGHLDPAVRPLGLNEREVADLVAFLEALTSDERPGVGPVTNDRAKKMRVQILDLHGKPVRSLDVTVRPFGDRLRSRERATPITLTTSRNGIVEFDMPAWTHVMLEADGYEIADGRPLPDYVRHAKLMAAPREQVALLVKSPGSITRMPANITAYREGTGKEVVALFKRVRSLKGNQALYVAYKDDITEFVDVRLDYQPKGVANRVYEMDLRGGWTETINLSK